jgi:hypothetical protein
MRAYNVIDSNNNVTVVRAANPASAAENSLTNGHLSLTGPVAINTLSTGFQRWTVTLDNGRTLTVSQH